MKKQTKQEFQFSMLQERVNSLEINSRPKFRLNRYAVRDLITFIIAGLAIAIEVKILLTTTF